MAAQKGKRLLLGILIIVVLIIVWLVFKSNANQSQLPQTTGGSEQKEQPINLSKSGYQAVIMVNDQIYIGKVDNLNSQFIKLNDAFRLSVSQSKEADKTDLQLTRLEEGIHGPTNTMLINRDHISIVEDLRTDSKLIEIIRSYDKQS